MRIAMSFAGHEQALTLIRSFRVALFLTAMCGSYSAYVRGSVHIEPLIQSFSLNFAAEKIVCQVLMSGAVATDVHTLSRISLIASYTAIGTALCVFNQYTAIVLFGAVCGAAQGGLLASERTLELKMTVNWTASFLRVHLSRLISTLVACTVVACAVMYASKTALKHEGYLFVPAAIHALVGAFLLKNMPRLSDAVLTGPQDVERSSGRTETRAVNMHVFVFPFVAGVLCYYDIIFPFMILYTNHINARPYIQLHDLPWIDFDSMATVFMVIVAFRVISDVSGAVFELFVTRRAQGGLFYACTAAKLVCVAVLPVHSIVLASVAVAAVMSGSWTLTRTLNSFNAFVENRCLAASSMVMFVLMTAGSHIDNETLSISMTVSVAIAALLVTFVVAVLTLTSATIDTSFAHSVIQNSSICLIATTTPHRHADCDNDHDGKVVFNMGEEGGA